MKDKSKQRSQCPISISLDLFGDKWSLLILRDLIFKQKKYFREFLASDEKIATNILTSRLRLLESENIIMSQVDPNNAKQKIYTLTQKGAELIPLLLELIIWGAKYGDSAAPKEFIERALQDRENLIKEIQNSIMISDH
jgi:DNA-binding HxlR family transcriptional regulator